MRVTNSELVKVDRSCEVDVKLIATAIEKSEYRSLPQTITKIRFRPVRSPVQTRVRVIAGLVGSLFVGIGVVERAPVHAMIGAFVLASVVWRSFVLEIMTFDADSVVIERRIGPLRWRRRLARSHVGAMYIDERSKEGRRRSTTVRVLAFELDGVPVRMWSRLSAEQAAELLNGPLRELGFQIRPGTESRSGRADAS